MTSGDQTPTDRRHPPDLTRTRQDGAVGSPLLDAFERTWNGIRARHPELPAAVFTLGSGSLGERRGLRLGHFAAARWVTRDGVDLPEIFVGGEGLARGPRSVLATIIHEAAHALAEVRGIQDTSRQGRYHNARFKSLAEELGLRVERDDVLGWSPTTLPDSTAARYSEELGVLAAALIAHRRREPVNGPGRAAGTLACTCACPRRIRVSRSALAPGPILCSVCDAPFAPAAAG